MFPFFAHLFIFHFLLQTNADMFSRPWSLQVFISSRGQQTGTRVWTHPQVEILISKIFQGNSMIYLVYICYVPVTNKTQETTEVTSWSPFCLQLTCF